MRGLIVGAILNEVEKAAFGDGTNFQARNPLGRRNAISRRPGRDADCGPGGACPRDGGPRGEQAIGATVDAPDRHRAARSRRASALDEWRADARSEEHTSELQ